MYKIQEHSIIIPEKIIYKYNELTEGAKQKAFENWNESRCEFLEHDELMQSLKTFAELFEFKIGRYELGGYSYNYIDWTPKNDNVAELWDYRLFNWVNKKADKLRSGKIYMKRDWNKRRTSKVLFEDYMDLTGMWSDSPLLNAVDDFLNRVKKCKLICKKFKSYTGFITDCIDSFIEFYNKSYEWFYSKECFEDYEAYLYIYNEDGSIYCAFDDEQLKNYIQWE